MFKFVELLPTHLKSEVNEFGNIETFLYEGVNIELTYKHVMTKRAFARREHFLFLSKCLQRYCYRCIKFVDED